MSFRGLSADHARRRVFALVVGLTLVAGACSSGGVAKNVSTTETTVSDTTTTPRSVTSGTGATTPGNSTTSAAPTTSAAHEPAPDTPTGLFLNSHTLSISGADAPTAGQSVCKTSPGANCDIRFTNDTGTHTLGSKVAGADGIAEWSWTPADVGLTVGHWDVEIVASRGAATASSIDPLGLQIDP